MPFSASVENGYLDGEDTPPLNPGLEGGAALGRSVCVYMYMCVSVRKSECMYINYVHVSLVGVQVAVHVHVHTWYETVIQRVT